MCVCVLVCVCVFLCVFLCVCVCVCGCTRLVVCLSAPQYLPLSLPGRLGSHHASTWLWQVWESTPGFGDSPLLESLWTAIDEAVEMKECDVYTYNSDQETDPFGNAPSPCLCPSVPRVLQQQWYHQGG